MLIDFEINNIYIEYVVCNHGSLLNIQITISTVYTSRSIITNLTHTQHGIQRMYVFVIMNDMYVEYNHGLVIRI